MLLVFFIIFHLFETLFQWLPCIIFFLDGTFIWTNNTKTGFLLKCTIFIEWLVNQGRSLKTCTDTSISMALESLWSFFSSYLLFIITRNKPFFSKQKHFLKSLILPIVSFIVQYWTITALFVANLPISNCSFVLVMNFLKAICSNQGNPFHTEHCSVYSEQSYLCRFPDWFIWEGAVKWTNLESAFWICWL